jgi:hypothetical protein
MSRRQLHQTLLSLLAALAATALMAVPLGPAPALAAKPKPKITKIKHLGTFPELPGSQVSFTLIKRGKVLVKAVDVQISVTLLCNDGQGGYSWNFFDLPYATSFPDQRIGRNPFGTAGFAVEDIPLTEFDWGYKRFSAFLKHRGRSAWGDIRIRWEQEDGSRCGGAPETWISHAV